MASYQHKTKILILTGSIGSGHLSVARAIADALYRMKNPEADTSPPLGLEVEIVDFMTALKNIVTTATKKIYLSSLRISPKIYELLFSHSSEKEWPMKLLNILSAPFMQRKFLRLMREKKPDVLVSTFPTWDILIKKTWKKYTESNGTNAPFVSILTDSISVHSVWTMGNPDFFIVPNEDTKISLQNFGVPAERIRVFGYPVDQCFLKDSSCIDFQKKWNLSPKKKTLLLILSAGIRFAKVKKIVKAVKASTLTNIQLLIIAGENKTWKEKLTKVEWPLPVRVTGWTNEMHHLIHGSDIVLTKAGGATVMECINSQKPMIIIEAIPGQEIGNAMLVQKYNLGVVLNNDLSDFDRALKYILSHEALIKKNLAGLQKPNAAEDIAKFLVGLTKSL